jgi:asparagine synthase (glutamine-hydrolysing)
MKLFVGLIDWANGPVADAAQRRYESVARAAGLAFRWCTVGGFSALLGADDGSDTDLIACHEGQIAVGDVRLDNRGDLERWAACSDHAISDLKLVLRVIAKHGRRYVPAILGDFAFVIWNGATHTALAACDALAVKKLYYTERNGVLAFASRGEALASGESYDVQYLAELLAYCPASPGRSVYAGVNAFPAATLAVVEKGRLTTDRYWSAYDSEPQAPRAPSEREAAETCRRLLAEAVSSRLTGRHDAWAQLSGGMDSSSVVSMAQWLTKSEAVPAGVAGTVTYVDSHGTGADEREYSDAVAESLRIRNETIVDAVMWQQDDLGPPRSDQPSGLFPFYARDRRLAAIVRGAGGRVLLTGQGGDDLFGGNMFFFADWLAAGRIGPAFHEMARRAAIGRASFWELAYKNALLPLLPSALQRRLVKGEGQVPPWIHPTVARRYELRSRASASQAYAGRVGHKYSDAIAALVAAIPAKLPTGVLDEALDVRHPYLYRPLVEFALRLPAELSVRPYARKWILREAMRGILPEVVRSRVGKGVLYGLLSWSTISHRAYLEPLLRDPMLAELGIIDATQFRAAFTAAQYERDRSVKISPNVQYTLAIEAWLQVRSGRWPAGSEGHSSVTNRNAPDARGELRRQA